ncbi:4'-phosphopantetheinyl transferase superfamily protein [Bacteroides sp.]|uniref:4'-phosphopantetheinyl transferase family protein n=1 Tax=Bacteroides sp. TaxID=29523 RepID=UPI0026302C35|nr:4'-phosphopantetheinyl transferase superfamily protein [Bacteroides sp.]MDD3037865.1 4'-phosphopantetheinyl transferase superfamily protein [Bacteroides sp.]
MALLLEHREKSCQLAVWMMEESVEELLSLFPSSSKVFYEKEIQQFTTEHRRLEWLSVRALLFTLLGEVKKIGYEPSGKPYLEDGSFHVSFSHTKEYVAVILSCKASVGIDIEHYGERIYRVISRFMRPDEQAFPYQEDVTWGLLLHWSAKEAIYKCMKDADADLRKLRLAHFVPQMEGQFQAQEYVTEQNQLFTVRYCIGISFVLTWVLES